MRNRHRRWPSFLAMLALTAASAAAQTRGGGLTAATIAEIERAISQEMSRQGIPGLSAAVGTDGELRWSAGFGLADLENSVPATASSVYRLGSISKPITAVAAQQLAERGKLALDSPIQEYVPGFPIKPWPVTIRQLLSHLGGIRHYRSQEEMDSTRHYRDLSEPLRIFQDDPLEAEPGTRYVYTTYGYVLLGAAVERAAGVHFADYLRERIFQPAGMETIRPDNVFAIIPHRARGYRKTSAGGVENCALADTSNKIPGGGLASRASDLVKFALAVDKGVLLGSDAVKAMFTEQKTSAGKQTGYGLGWTVRRVNGRTQVGHGGGQQGVSTILALAPGEGAAVALMSNLERSELSRLADRIVALLLP